MLKENRQSGGSSPTSRNVNIPKLLKLLESDEKHVENEARQALKYQLEAGSGIRFLVNHFYEHGSERALDLLCTIRDQHDWALLDIVKEMMSSKQKTPAAIVLLGQIVQEAPSWVPRIATHDIFYTVLNFINRSHSDVESEDVAALLFLASLLPHCAIMGENQLKHLFDTFINASAFLQSKIHDIRENPNPIDRINVSHFQFAVREFFHVLYGIYPYMLLNYMRGTFRERPTPKHNAIFEDVVMPLLNGVKLHPNLLLLDKDRELSRERWVQREAHDFLDDCRRVVIGLIPNFHNPHCTNQLEAETENDDLADELQQELFRKQDGQSEGGKLPNGQTSESANNLLEAVGYTGRFDLMELLNTPECSRSTSPHSNRIPPESVRDIVITPRRRETSGESTSFFRKLVKIGKKAIAPLNNERKYDPLIHVVEEVRGDSASGTVSTADEADETIDVVKILNKSRIVIAEEAPATISIKNEVEEEVTEEPKPRSRAVSARSARVSDVRLSGEFDRWGESAGNIRMGRRSDPMANYLDEATAAREAAREEVRNRGFTLDETKLHLNDAGEITYFGKNLISSDSSSLASNEGDNDASGEQSPQTPQHPSRFSVSAFFKKINRQRFHSECPPGTLMIHGDHQFYEDVEEAIEDDDQARAEQQPGQINSCAPPRSSSCPDIREMLKRRRSVPDAAHLAQKRRSDAIAFPSNDDDMIRHFPYLKLLRGPDITFYGKLERAIEKQYENNRAGYMAASKAYHETLKDLYLADRLPGRIYDDLSHIMNDLTPESQRLVLQSRLRLVNQHLMYERSTRLLHANRNKKLYWRIRQQKNLENELARHREIEAEMLHEREVLIKALSQMRIREQKARVGLNTLIGEYNLKLRELNMHNKEVEQSNAEKDMLIQQLEEKLAERELPFCIGWRKATDLEACAKIMHDELEATRVRIESLQCVSRENQQLRDRVEVLQHRHHDGDALDEASRKIKNLEHSCEEFESAIATATEEKQLFEATIRRLEAELTKKTKENNRLYEDLRKSESTLNEATIVADLKFNSLQQVCKKLENNIERMYLRIESLGLASHLEELKQDEKEQFFDNDYIDCEDNEPPLFGFLTEPIPDHYRYRVERHVMSSPTPVSSPTSRLSPSAPPPDPTNDRSASEPADAVEHFSPPSLHGGSGNSLP